LVFVGSLVLSAPDPNIASTDPRSPVEEAKGFHLPPGFEIQLVASEPEIHKPLNLAFDDHGRLWVTDTVEYPFAAKDKPRDGVKILEDFGPDGRARKVTNFSGGLNIPIGVLPLPATKPQQALLYSIPDIWRISEDGDRQVVYKEYGFRDTHGMTSAFTPGFDGWIYACHGFANDSTVRASDGSSVKMNSGNTYRFKSDGSHVEAFTHGQVNPFGLCFDPLGNLYSADCHSQPIYQLLRGAYYPSFGKPHDGLGFAPEMYSGYTDSTAIAGVVYYAADNYPKAYRDCAYIGDVVTNRLVRFQIAWRGSSPRATMDYFLKSDDPWFRPVAIQLGPDGALYVADFYNRIIGHYEVPLDHPGRDRERGRVWRIVYKGPEGSGTPAPRQDWAAASIDDLINDLAHPNLAVRMQATTELVARHDPRVVDALVKALHEPANAGPNKEWLRAHAIRVLDQYSALPADLLWDATHDRRRAVRVHAYQVEHGSSSLREGFKDEDAFVRRAAADRMGMERDVQNIRPLLDLRLDTASHDTHLIHVVRMALREQLLLPAAYGFLAGQHLSPSQQSVIIDVSLGVQSANAALYLLGYAKQHPEELSKLVPQIHHIARYGDSETRAALFQFTARFGPDDLLRQAELLRAMVRGTQERGASVTGPLQKQAEELVAELLDSKKTHEVKEGIELVGSLQLEANQPKVVAVAANNGFASDVRGAALTALANLDAAKHAASLGGVLGDATAPVELREQAAALLARSNRPDTLNELLRTLPSAPARLQNAIAVGLAGSSAGADKLFEAIAAGKASARLLQERAVEVKLQSAKIPNLKEQVAKLTAGLPPADQKLNELLKKRRTGFAKAKADVALGRKIFEKNCAICHQLSGQGAKIGPQLDGVGIRGVDRLLEDTLDPNRNVDQAFRTTVLSLKKGQLVSGLLLREEGALLVLADNQGKEVRIPKDAVEERSTSQMSPMPANFADQIPESDFYHLLAFLLQQRVAVSERK
jgi:putative membrane-bound dehydrogenase-like protein